MSFGSIGCVAEANGADQVDQFAEAVLVKTRAGAIRGGLP